MITFNEFKNMFILTLTHITCDRPEPIMNGVQDTAILLKKFPRLFHSWGQIKNLSVAQTLEYFKESFPSEIEPQLLEIDDIHAAIVKA